MNSLIAAQLLTDGVDPNKPASSATSSANVMITDYKSSLNVPIPTYILDFVVHKPLISVCPVGHSQLGPTLVLLRHVKHPLTLHVAHMELHARHLPVSSKYLSAHPH